MADRSELKYKPIIRVTLVIAAALMIAVGINAGGFRDVLGRAVMICLECVGMG